MCYICSGKPCACISYCHVIPAYICVFYCIAMYVCTYFYKPLPLSLNAFCAAICSFHPQKHPCNMFDSTICLVSNLILTQFFSFIHSDTETSTVPRHNQIHKLNE